MESRIGEAAGKIWESLKVRDLLSITEIGKVTGLPSNVLNQGIGWLAREGKLTSQKRTTDGKEVIRLR